MKKASYYKWSTTDYMSTKGITIMMNHGHAGYGIYHLMMQVIANTDDRTLLVSELPQVSYQLRIELPKLLDIVNNYFEVEDGIITSNDLENSLKEYDSLIQRLNASAGGKASAASMSKEERIERAKKANAAKYQTKSDEIIPNKIILDNTILDSMRQDSKERVSIVQGDSKEIARKIEVTEEKFSEVLGLGKEQMKFLKNRHLEFVLDNSNIEEDKFFKLYLWTLVLQCSKSEIKIKSNLQLQEAILNTNVEDNIINDVAKQIKTKPELVISLNQLINNLK